jgi:inosine-uridine nucleoside N-ribohydrolase
VSAPIIIDCDPGHDDAIALLLALASRELELLAVTTVAGNQTLVKTTTNALRVLELVGRGDVLVAAGAERPLVRGLEVSDWIHGDSGLDGPVLGEPTSSPDPRHAIDVMADLIESHVEPITLVPIGPLTNVALLLARYPHLAPRIGRVVLMGGAVGLGNVTPAAEFNVWQDPEAAHRVFASGLDLTMIGLDVTHRALLGPVHAEQLRGTGVAGRFVAELLDFFASRNADVYELRGAPIHDAVAVAHAIRGDLVSTEHLHVDVDCGWGPSRGRTNADRWARGSNPPNAHVALDIDAVAFSDYLVERIASLDENVPASS